MRKRLLIFLITLSSMALFSLPANASTQALGTCLIDSLTGKERKLLAKWIYFAIAAHPEMSSYSKITANDRVQSDKYVGGLVTRLLAEDCASEFRTAQKANPLALQQAFEMVGQVAMQELMTNQSVTTAVSSYINYADQNKINAVLAKP